MPVLRIDRTVLEAITSKYYVHPEVLLMDCGTQGACILDPSANQLIKSLQPVNAREFLGTFLSEFL